jgi:serine/threonine protein kinase
MNEPTQSPWLTERYIPQTCLGRKAGRQTWLAIDQVTGDSVVVKHLAFGRDFLWDDLKLFEREAQTLKSIDHPAIPCYLDFFDLESEGEQGFALVQSYIDARSLEEHVKSGRRFSESDLKEIAIQVLEILDYLHHCQPPVIHRDIKPSNILLAESEDGVGTVYLVDFGSVQSLAAREGSTITIVGTYGYMPPEQFGGRAYPSSDFYSLGATLIYLATGKHPADIPQGKDLRLNFEPLANLSLEMTGWIREMTHPLPDERPDSARSAVQYLANYSNKVHKPTTVKPQPIVHSKPSSCIVEHWMGDNDLNLRIPATRVSLSQNNGPSVPIASRPLRSSITGCLFHMVFWSACFYLIRILFHDPILFAMISIGSIPILRLAAWVVNRFSSPTPLVYLKLENQYLTINWDDSARCDIDLKYSKYKVSKIKEISYSKSTGQGGSTQIYFIEIESDDLSVRIELSRDEGRWIAMELGTFLKLPVTMSGEKIA